MPDTPAVMFVLPVITFDVPILLYAGLALAVAGVAVGVARRASAPVISYVLVGMGVVLLAAAAGEPRGSRGGVPSVAVVVDASASTRGAAHHDESVLRADIEELLGDRPYTIVRMGDASDDETRWTLPPPGTSAVLLFSDGRFEPPATAPPVYPVIDPALEGTGDAAVTSLERRGERVTVSTSNQGGIQGGSVVPELIVDGNRTPIPRGVRTFALPATHAATTVARLTGGDAWPENDVLTLAHLPPALAEQWWVGDGAPAGWRAFAPTDLPVEAGAWLAPFVVALHNVPANALSRAQAQRLEQYVHDLGGGLLILGGDQAFAAGGYDGSALAALSPLASSPPAPAAHWTFLLDASGSMAAEANGRSRLAAAVAAARGAAAELPPNDLLSVAGFADGLRWWTRGKPVKDLMLSGIPPPRGPTNLDAALRALASSLDRGAVNHIVLLTDGQVELPQASEIAAALKNANARLHVFAVGTGPGLSALPMIAEATGGTYAEQLDVAGWTSGLTRQLRPVTPRHWNTTPVGVGFDDLPPVTTRAWNRTWLKRGADELGRTATEESVPMAAQMNVGAGKVAAVALRPPDGHVDALAQQRVQSPPRDPRVTVNWRTGRRLSVTIDAADEKAPINGLSYTLALSSDGATGARVAVQQTGPGRYELSLPAPRSSALATLSESGRVVDRFAVASRYLAEFDAIGNDRAALQSLAERTGGRLIEPHERGPIALRTPAPRGTPLAPPLAAAGALLVGLGLVAWRVQR